MTGPAMPDPARLARRTVTVIARRYGVTRAEASRTARQVVVAVIYALGDDTPDLQQWLRTLLDSLGPQAQQAPQAAAADTGTERTTPS